jgi:predicted transglutaminase-like protease
MPTYEIEQYELHVMKYRVEAASEAEAIAKVLNGTAMPVDNSLEYIEVAEDFGMPTEEYRELAEALRGLGVQVDEVIPSIRSVEEV